MRGMAMSEQRFTYDKPIVAFSKGGINDNVTGKTYEFTMDTVLDLLNGQQDQIIYWKHKVGSLLWILSQFDKEKVKKLLEELLNEQQATIEQLQDLCGKSDGENSHLRIENKRLQEENEKLRRLFVEIKRPITIDLTEEDEQELRKLLGLIDDE